MTGAVLPGRAAPPSVDAALITRAAALPAATLHEAGGRTGDLPAAIKPVRAGMRVVGRGLPVLCPPGDNLWLHRAIATAEPGEVLVVAFTEGPDPAGYGHWGEVMAVAARERGVAGLVIDGGVRDGDQLAARGFPTFATAVCIRGTAKDPARAGSVGKPVRIGDVTVARGDLVVGDADGVVVLPAAVAARVVGEAVRREAVEQEIFDRLVAGETTMEIYDLPAADPGPGPPLVGAARPGGERHGVGPRDAARRSVTPAGLEHGANPVPAASRRGPLLATGGIRGVDPDTGVLGTGAAEQVRLAFRNLESLLRAGGGRPDDVVHVTVFAAADGLRERVNEEWTAMFPDPASRPARHLLRHELPGGMLVQLEALAYVDGADVAGADVDGGSDGG